MGEVRPSHPPRTGLSILCKRLAGTRALCNLRQGHKTELFTGLQLCYSCDLTYFPKVSARQIGLRGVQFLPTPLQNKKEFVLKHVVVKTPTCNCDEFKVYRNYPSLEVYRWKDIKSLATSATVR